MASKSGELLDKMTEGEFVVSVQIDPPTSDAVEDFIETIRVLMEAGVQLVDINSSRRISHDSIELAMALSQMGLETIPHVTTRDSSINGLLNQILAAYSWGGVRNFLIITGDPHEVSQAVIPSRGVFQTDSIGALKAVDEHLRRGEKFRLDVALAAAVNQNNSNFEREGNRIREKQISGADFFMSQPVFSEEQIEHLRSFYRANSSRPILIGVWPLFYQKTIETIRAGRIAGVEIPDEVYGEIGQYFGDEGALRLWGLARALDLIEYIRNQRSAEGIYIVAPSRNPLLLLDLLRRI